MQKMKQVIRFDVRSDGAINTVMSTDGGDALHYNPEMTIEYFKVKELETKI